MKLFFRVLILSFVFASCQHHPKMTASPAGVIFADNENPNRDITEAKGSLYAISTQGPNASRAGQAMFAAGGNIIDAAVAVSFVLSVERPESTGIGGGGFMLYFDGKTKETYAIDFRERAPYKAKKNMYLDAHGQLMDDASRDGILSVATPGVVAGLLEIHKKFGKLPLKTVMQPSIDLAENGFPINVHLAEAIDARSEDLETDAAAKAIFLDAQGKPWAEGHVLVQKDLASTLRTIAEDGRSGFYNKTAREIVKFSDQKKGLFTLKDFAKYQVKWRKPLRGHFNDFEVISMPPPSSGGIHVIQFLNFLSQDNLAQKGILSTTSIHLAAASLQDAFADRAHFLGDPDFVKAPVDDLISLDYSLARRKDVNITKARKADQVKFGKTKDEHLETTHFSILDSDGNAVASTQTINGWMGSGVVVPGTGVLLNNEMDDFAIQPGVANMFGAVGGKANSIQPLKTPLSSMAPTFLVKDGTVRLSLGAPGGTRIISCVAQTILNYTEFKLPLYESVAMIRYHHQWKPDVLTIDSPGPKADVQKSLRDMGYDLKIGKIPCFVMAVSREGDILHAVTDPRDSGLSLAR